MSMPLWMNSWAWQMAFGMIGAAVIWCVLIVASAWLIARWELRVLQRVNASSLQLQRVQLAHGEIDPGAYEDIQKQRTSE